MLSGKKKKEQKPVLTKCFTLFFFFNIEDRVDFIHAVVDFQNKSKKTFDREILFNKLIYELRTWKQEVTVNPTFHDLLDFSLLEYADVDLSIASIWIFMKNGYHHYAEYEENKVLFQILWDNETTEINAFFFLDSMTRELANEENKVLFQILWDNETIEINAFFFLDSMTRELAKKDLNIYIYIYFGDLFENIGCH
jgi:hypothetical protein